MMKYKVRIYRNTTPRNGQVTLGLALGWDLGYIRGRRYGSVWIDFALWSLVIERDHA